MALTKKRQAFIEEYLRCWNATEAARRAGYKHPNVQGPTLVNLSEIKEIVEGRIAELTMSADEALVRLAQIGRGDLAHYILPDGELDLDALRGDGLGHLLKKFKKVVKTTVTGDGRELRSEWAEAELYDAQGALNTLAKIHGLTGPSGSEDDPINIKVTVTDD